MPVAFLALGTSCQSRRTAVTTPAQPSGLSGGQLAATYCGNCHLLPDPSLLPKAMWSGRVLPQMALRLGFMADSLSPLMNLSDPLESNRVLQAQLFTNTPVMHRADWDKIVAHYVGRAPAQPVPQPAKPAVAVGLPLFAVRTPPQRIAPSVTMLRYDATGRRILAGNGQGKVYQLSPALRLLDSAQVGSPPTDFRVLPNGQIDVLTAGNMEPNDQLRGTWQSLRFGGPGNVPSVRIDSLGRPVGASFGDFNQDGREDVVICQFGNYVGRLSWFENSTTGYREHLLDPVPGARRTVVRDVNRDGRPDIVALLAQGDEQIAVYYNDGGGRFTKQVVLRFPSVYGSSYFDLTDLDGDGDEDILYTAGDNGDNSYSLKAYHGVRVFLNDGRAKFSQTLFYPLHGAAQAIARDFDQDGDVDIAAISFFPDYDQKPVEAFVYLENQGGFRVKARTFPQPERGHWIVMEAADVDQDGDDDLLLGSFFRSITPTPQPLQQRWFTDGQGILLLENRLKRPNVPEIQ